MINKARNWLWQVLVDWLNDIPKGNQNMQAINNFDHLLRDLRPADVILFEGRSRVSEVIKIITLSPWTHAALYIGRMNEIHDPDTLARVKNNYNGDPSKPLVIESLLGFGTVINPLDEYTEDNLRICRPDVLSFDDQNKVVHFATEHLGMCYDVRQLLDLARFMFPYAILPRRWRSSLFQHNAGKPTNIVCSSMIARCFHSVNYPMLPTIYSDHHDRLKLHKRNFRLFVPSDFDYSPYFHILKFPSWPSDKQESYRDLPWEDETDEEESEHKNRQKNEKADPPKKKTSLTFIKSFANKDLRIGQLTSKKGRSNENTHEPPT